MIPKIPSFYSACFYVRKWFLCFLRMCRQLGDRRLGDTVFGGMFNAFTSRLCFLLLPPTFAYWPIWCWTKKHIDWPKQGWIKNGVGFIPCIFKSWNKNQRIKEERRKFHTNQLNQQYRMLNSHCWNRIFLWTELLEHSSLVLKVRTGWAWNANAETGQAEDWTSWTVRPTVNRPGQAVYGKL